MNPLNVPIQDFVDYAAVRPEHIEEAIPALLAKARSAVELAALDDRPATWELVVDAVDSASEPLWRAWSIAGHLNAVINTPELREAYNAMLPAISEYSTWVGLHTGLYAQYKRLHESPQFLQLSAQRQRVIELGHHRRRHAGRAHHTVKRCSVGHAYSQLLQGRYIRQHGRALVAHNRQAFDFAGLDLNAGWHDGINEHRDLTTDHVAQGRRHAGVTHMLCGNTLLRSDHFKPQMPVAAGASTGVGQG